MKISATIGDSEYDLLLRSNVNDSWIGEVEIDLDIRIVITFNYSEGVISELEIEPIVGNDRGIILERLINAFREFNESHQMGFEAEDLSTYDSEGLKPYDPEEIRVRPVFFSAFQVNMDIAKGKIDLNPEFQRNFVWSDAQKSLLIESMLLKIPLPAFYFAEDKKGRYQVVDGLQRLTVINQFLNNKFKLKKLQYLHHLEGKYFSIDLEKGITEKQALQEPYDSRVEGTQLNINVIEASSPLKVKYDIFYRINTGGRPLNRQEIRNCFASERTRKLLKQMAGDPIFNKATGNSVKDTRMDAQELALRFCGFYMYREFYVGDMNGFLDDVLEKLNELSDRAIMEIQAKYYHSLENAYYLFGDFAFRKILPEHLAIGARRQFLNKAMFIVWTSILADIETERIEETQQQMFANILAHELIDDNELLNSLTTGTTDRLKLEYVTRKFTTMLINFLSE